jgi:hypothetical protein
MSSMVTKKVSSSGEVKAENSQTAGYFIYFLFGLIEILLLFRLIFKLTGANPESNFVHYIYLLTQLLIAPFFGIFHQATTQGIETTAIFEPATFVAIVVYAVLAWGITQLVMILSRRVQ